MGLPATGRGAPRLFDRLIFAHKTRGVKPSFTPYTAVLKLHARRANYQEAAWPMTWDPDNAWTEKPDCLPAQVAFHNDDGISHR